MQFIVNSEAELADRVWGVIESKLTGNFVIGLIGDLGAGKTTLVKQILSKIDHNIIASSPTFTIIKTYDTGDLRFNHIDLYRLGEQCSDPDVKDALENGVSFVEWFDLYRDQTRAEMIIGLEAVGENSRKVTIENID